MPSPNVEKAIVVNKLVKTFGSFMAVNHVSFEVSKGMIYGFLGPNGAGKSTTIRMLCGLLTPTSGEGWVDHYNIYTETEKIKAHIGYMSQKFSLYDDLTVEENLNFYSGIYRVPPSKKQERKDWVIQMAGLEDRIHSLTSTLSTGWKQRLALGCAILHEPSILFLDEPTAGVDPINRRRFWNLIYELSNQKITVFVTTHYMDEAEYFDQIGLIYKGQLIANATPQELKTKLMRQIVLEMQCEKPQEALFVLQQLPGIHDIIFVEDNLHFIADNLEQASSLIHQALKQFKTGPIKQVQPSLEDVFISLTEQFDQQFAG
jgi:ABC-2 type transport system ATP-binding protein